MDPIWLALIAIVFVILGVLVLRLHPFLSLIFGALFVAVTTPQTQLIDFNIEQEASKVVSVESSRLTVKSGRPASGKNLVFRQSPDTRSLEQVGDVYLYYSRSDDDRATVEGNSIQLRPHDLVIHASLASAAFAAANDSAGKRLAFGFGDTCRKIAILIAMASVIGTCLLESGAARRIVDSTRSLVGEKRTPLAFTVSGFIVAIPVFFDTVFYLLIPLARAMRLKTGHNYLLYVMSIVVGATMAHSLVPPTPGPLFVASEMGVSIGTMMIGGVIVGTICAGCGYLYVLLANRLWEIPLRDSTGLLDATTASSTKDGQTDDDDSGTAHMPSLMVSLLPILLPVVLLAGWTLMDARLKSLASRGIAAPDWLTSVKPWLDFFGDKNVALIVAAVVAITTLVWQKRRSGSTDIRDSVQAALASGGVIILITAAGGAFGHVLRQSGIAEAIQYRFPSTENSLLLLVLAFCITAVVRFAQGSATVAMITCVSIVAPLASSMTLGYHPVYLALAIGCGSKPLPWMNDSGFWVVGRMSGMTEAETLKIHSVTLTLMGIIGFLVTMAGAKWLPLVS